MYFTIEINIVIGDHYFLLFYSHIVMQKTELIKTLWMENNNNTEIIPGTTKTEELIVRVLNTYRMALSKEEIIRRLRQDNIMLSKKDVDYSLLALKKNNRIVTSDLNGSKYWVLKSNL